MTPDHNHLIAVTEAVTTDDQLVALASLASKLADALHDDRLSTMVAVPSDRRTFSRT